MPMTNFPDGFTDGLSVRGLPLLQTQPGQIFWLGNSSVLNVGQRAGSDGNRGTYLSPFATLAGALTFCVADRGDIIMVLPGHAETISSATALALNVAGVAIIGIGAGSKRPTFTLDTANTANIPVTAANVSIQNCVFVANFLAIASVFTATGTSTPTDFAISNCEFRDTSSVLNFVSVFTGNATANSCDGFSFTKNKVYGLGTTATTTAIKLASATSRVVLSDNYAVQPVLNDTAVLAAFGANNMLNLDISRNKVYRPSTSTTGHLFSSTSTASTGYVYDNYAYHLDATAALLAPTGTGLGFQNNYCMITGAADKSGLINPAAV